MNSEKTKRGRKLTELFKSKDSAITTTLGKGEEAQKEQIMAASDKKGKGDTGDIWGIRDTCEEK